MQQICSVNGLGAPVMFGPSLIPTPPLAVSAGSVLYTQSTDQQCSILLHPPPPYAPQCP